MEILYVEDNPEDALMFETFLGDMANIEVCSSPYSALNMISIRDFDYVVLDLHLRLGSSAVVAQTLIDRGIPFMFFTSADKDDVVQEVGEELLDRCLFKNGDRDPYLTLKSRVSEEIGSLQVC